MIIYCDSDGNVSSIPSRLTFGESLTDITIITPQQSSAVLLKVEPPSGEKIPDLIGNPIINEDGVLVYNVKVYGGITATSGRCYYQIEFIGNGEYIDFDNSGKEITAKGVVKWRSERGSFVIQRGTTINGPASSEMLKDYALDELYSLLGNLSQVQLRTLALEGITGIGNRLETKNQNIIGAINELNRRPSGGGGGGGGGTAVNEEDIINKILDPDNYPLEEDTTTVRYNVILEPGKLNRNTGENRDGEGGLRTPDYIPIGDFGHIKPIFETTSDGLSEICMLGYKADYTFAGWYGYIDSNEDYNLEENSLPADCAYLRGYISTEDEEGSITFELSNGYSKKAEHKKVYMADHGYSIYGNDIDDETMHKLVIAAEGLDGNTFNITEIKAPVHNPEEATLALMNWGNGRKQIVDISSMTYDAEKPTVEIVCQTRGGEPLPEFSIRYNDGEGAGRVRKFTVYPDAIPIELTSKGLKVRRNNDYNNNKNEEDFATIDLFKLAQSISEEGKQKFIDEVIAALPVYNGEVESV